MISEPLPNIKTQFSKKKKKKKEEVGSYDNICTEPVKYVTDTLRLVLLKFVPSLLSRNPSNVISNTIIITRLILTASAATIIQSK